MKEFTFLLQISEQKTQRPLLPYRIDVIKVVENTYTSGHLLLLSAKRQYENEIKNQMLYSKKLKTLLSEVAWWVDGIIVSEKQL